MQFVGIGIVHSIARHTAARIDDIMTKLENILRVGRLQKLVGWSVKRPVFDILEKPLSFEGLEVPKSGMAMRVDGEIWIEQHEK